MILYLTSRLYNLLNLPAFIDEAIHIRRARFSLSSAIPTGKWLSIALVKMLIEVLPGNPLLTARLASVLCGSGTLIAVVLLGTRLYSKREGLIAGGLYVVTPYLFFYDRLALTDGWMAMFGAYALLLSIVLVEGDSPWPSLLLMIALSAAILTKVSAAPLVLMPVAAVFTLKQRREWLAALARIAPALFGVSLLLVALYLRDFGTGTIAGKIDQGQALADMFPLLRDNLTTVGEWVWMLATPPLAVVMLSAVLWAGLVSRRRQDWLLLAVMVMSTGPILVRAATFYPRYFVFALLPLLLLTARWLSVLGTQISVWLTRQRAGTSRRLILYSSLTAILVVWPIALNATIATAPQKARLPHAVRVQYITGWSAGYGLQELADYLEEIAASEANGILVLRFPVAAHPYMGLELYLEDSENLQIDTVRVPPLESHTPIVQPNPDRRTFVVIAPPGEEHYLGFFEQSVDMYLRNAHQLRVFPRPGGESAIELWEVE